MSKLSIIEHKSMVNQNKNNMSNSSDTWNVTESDGLLLKYDTDSD